MRTVFRFLQSIFVVGLIAGVSLLFSAAVQAQNAPTLTDSQKQKLVSNCVSVKSSLSQLHATDALLRVNRGQLYESMATKLMDRFNSRLGGDSLDNKAMLTVTESYRTQLTQFRTHYINYEQKLSTTLTIDCTAQPDKFYAALEEARALRKTVHGDIAKLHRYIDDYRSSVNGFLVNYERVSE